MEGAEADQKVSNFQVSGMVITSSDLPSDLKRLKMYVQNPKMYVQKSAITLAALIKSTLQVGRYSLVNLFGFW